MFARQLAKVFLPVLLVATVALSFAQKTEASESPLKKIISEYKKRTLREKKVTVFNQEEEIEDKTAKIEFEKFASEQEKNFSQKGWDWSEVEDAVEFASEKTGVRKNFLFGMLAVESDLGRNTGECSYEEVEQGAQRSYENGMLGLQAWRTFQHRRNLIKNIADGLGYDYQELRVSCNPAQYAGTGGALGVPQFMPDTWFEYKDRIAQAVGKENPDPWDLKDGVVAMALKLSDCQGVTSHNRIAEKNAAKLYLSGTTSYQYNWYANLVQYWAENYSRLVA